MSGTGAAVTIENDESRSQWIDWVHDFASRCSRGERQKTGKLDLVWSNTLLPVFNQAIVAEPVETASELDDIVITSETYAGERNVPWVVAVFEDCLSEPVLKALPQTMEDRGYERMFVFTGMAANSLIAPATPAGLSYRRVTTPEDGEIVGDINCNAYGMPIEWGRDFFSHPIVNGRDYMYLGMVGGQPLSTATVTPVAGRLYVSFVATDPAHHRKGYAGAVMYTALQEAIRETGITRTLLHASEAGYKVYERMGYHPINRASIWAKH